MRTFRIGTKHGISFEEAQNLFLFGAEYLEMFDWEHSEQKTGSLRSDLYREALSSSCGPREMKIRFVSSALGHSPRNQAV